MQRNNSKTSVSFLLSVALHGSAIAIIALGPAFMPGMLGEGNKDSEFIEFSIPESTHTLSDIKPVEVPPTPVAEPQPEVVTQPEPAKVETPVVTKAPVVVKKAAEPTLPEKQAEVVDENSDVVAPVTEDKKIEELAEEREEVSDEKFADIQEEEEPLPAPVPVADTPAEPIQEPQPEAVAETQPEPIAPAPQPVAQTPAPEQQPTPPAAGTGNSPNNGMAGSQQTIQVSQSYLGLRQMPGNKPPVYSRDMRRQGVQGRGQLVYFVTRDGRVTDLRLTRSTGSPALDQAAIDAFSKYKFFPGQEGYTVHDFEFSLNGPAEADGGKLRTSFRR